MSRQRPKTWRFNLTLQMPAFSAQDDVRMVFSSILDDADTRLAIHDLKQSSFSYDVPGERGLAEISEYLHSSEKTTAATVKTWIFDGRIVGDGGVGGCCSRPRTRLPLRQRRRLSRLSQAFCDKFCHANCSVPIFFESSLRPSHGPSSEASSCALSGQFESSTGNQFSKPPFEFSCANPPTLRSGPFVFETSTPSARSTLRNSSCSSHLSHHVASTPSHASFNNSITFRSILLEVSDASPRTHQLLLAVCFRNYTQRHHPA